MTDGKPFSSLVDVAVERERLNAMRRESGDRMERHWQALKDRDVRGVLLRDAASDMVRSWKPASLLAGLMGGGSLTSAVGAAVFRTGGLRKRLASFAFTMIVPHLLKSLGDVSIDRVITEVQATVDRLKQRWSERNNTDRQGS